MQTDRGAVIEDENGEEDARTIDIEKRKMLTAKKEPVDVAGVRAVGGERDMSYRTGFRITYVVRG